MMSGYRIRAGARRDPWGFPAPGERKAGLVSRHAALLLGSNRRSANRLEGWFHYWYHHLMAVTTRIIEQMRREPANVRFSDLRKVCRELFGKPSQQGSSHAIFKTPWAGNPRINIQDDKGRAKPYQVRQVLLAIQKLEDMRNAK